MTGMSRAQRRHLKDTVKRMVRTGGGLKHPVPDSVVLHGGPMDGWIVKPDAPALEADWRARYIEEAARRAYREWEEDTVAWEDLDAVQQASWIADANSAHGAGHYELRGKGQAEWVVES
jgi:hypothetical protein